MKNKSMLIAIVLCAGLGSGVSFGSESGKGWYDKLREIVWGTQESRMKRSSQSYDRHIRGLKGVAKIYAGTIGGVAVGSKILPDQLSSITSKITSPIKFMIDSNLISPLLGTVMLTILSASIIFHINVSSGEKEIIAAVEAIKPLIRATVYDSNIYPTKMSRMHALAKRSDFALVDALQSKGVESSDIMWIVIDRACGEIMEEVQKDLVVQNEDLINSKINTFNKEMINFVTLEDRIQYMQSNDKIIELSKLLDDPELKAGLSVLNRLYLQRVLEEKQPGMFAENTGAVVKQDLPEITKGSAERRREAWNNMLPAEQQQRRQLRLQGLSSREIGEQIQQEQTLENQ